MGRTELPGRCFLAAKSQWHRFLVIHGKPPALPISSPWVQSGTRSVAHSELSDRADARVTRGDGLTLRGGGGGGQEGPGQR